jgi:5-methylcytosine-specific restriction endonuclease McrA
MVRALKTRCNGQWTEARWNSFIKSALRSASNRWAPKQLVKKQARIARNTYVCALCGAKVGNKTIKIDHIDPVVDPVKGFTTWDSYIARMFPEVEGYQAICLSCHTAKTRTENQTRKENRK